MDTFQRLPLARLLVGAVCALTLGSCGTADDDGSSSRGNSHQEYAPIETRAQPVKTSDISGFCQMKTDRGEVPIEEYLTSVVSCEAAPGAGIEALKAQAIAARSFALHVNHAQGRPLRSSQADQHYDCGRPIRPEAREAVKQTAGVVGQYNETLVALFYKAGSENQSSSCRGIGTGATRTEHFITYNSGKRGSAVEGAYDKPSSNDNRGDMGQWGAKCLEDKKGKSALDILRFYYGEDIETIQLQGACVGDTVDPAVLTDGSTCSVESSKPEIVERHQWGARAPKAIRPKHDPYRIAIHHAVSPNNTNKPGAQAVRDIQYGHMYGYHDWSDIGYHFVIDRDGTIYRGNPEDRIGAHVGGNNTGNIGISFLGQYQPPSALGIPAGEPTDQQLKSAGRLAGYLADKYDIALDRQNVKGHREHGNSTSCPGDNLLDEIETIIEYAGAGILCGRPERPYDEVRETPDFELSSANYRYLKIEATSGDPLPHPDTVAGFEVDSVFYQSPGSDAVYASSVSSSSSGVQNAQGAVGASDNDDCATRSSNAALVPVGDELVLEFSEPFQTGDSVSVLQGQFGGFDGCDTGFTGSVWASTDGQSWVLLSNGVVGNTSGLSVPSSNVSFVSPRDQSTYATGALSLRVDSSPDVQEVEFFIGGESVGVASDWEAGFAFPFTFGLEGTVKVTVKAMGSDGQAIARDTVEVTLDNAFRFASPNGQRNTGHSPTHAPDLTLKVSGGPPEIVRVGYEMDAYELGDSTDASTGFALSTVINNMGERHLIAYGYDAQGDVIATAEINVTISNEIEAGIEFLSPRDGGWYTPHRVLRARALNPAIISVEYEIGDGQNICRSDNPNTDFRCEHKFSQAGWIELKAVGFDTREEFTSDADREEHKIGEATIKVLMTDENGVVPGSEVDPDDDVPISSGGSSGGAISCDGGTPQGTRQQLAQQILDNGSIVLQSNPRMNIQEAANGQPSTAGCGKPNVHLQEGVLAAMVKFGDTGGYTVTSLTTGCHSPTSNHYRGQALDVGAVGGTLVRPATPGLSFLNACQSCNAKEVLGPRTTPFAFANHDDHIHCAFP
jgi:hypothetical protein